MTTQKINNRINKIAIALSVLSAVLVLAQWFISGSNNCGLGGLICVLAGVALGALSVVMAYDSKH